MYQDQEKLVQALIGEKLLSTKQAEDIRTKALTQHLTAEEVLINTNLVDAASLTAVKGKLLNVPVANLAGLKVPIEVLGLIPQEVAENYEMVAFDKKGPELQVGLVNPENFKAIEAVEFLAQKAKLKITLFIISLSDFRSVLHQYQELGAEVEQVLEGFDRSSLLTADLQRDSKEMDKVIKSAPVSKMVLVIIRHAIDGKASDIHIEPTLQDTKVRYRIDGILRTSLVLPKYIHSAIVARIKVLASLKLDESRKPQDGRIRLTVEGRDIDFRVSTLPLFEGEKVVLRVLDTTAAVPKLEQLGFNPIYIKAIGQSLLQPHGLVLLTGPTGSGKTTTLYTLLTMLNSEGVNIITLEDPIEYYIEGVNQSQINSPIGYTFASGLRSILRQDPNIVMVGEIRDKETTELVIHASLTGHMILSTLHTNDSASAIPRLVDLGAEPFLLSSVINLIIAQRLARKICPDCKAPTTVPELMLKKVKEQLAGIPSKYFEVLKLDKSTLQFMKGQGCAHCGNTGYIGRVAVAEIITITPDIRKVINNAPEAEAMAQLLAKQDFISLTQDCLLKALTGITTLEEVVRVSQI